MIGGANSILNHAGEDCTDEFESIHSKAAWDTLSNFYIGDVADQEVEPLLNTDEDPNVERRDEYGNPIALGKNKYVAFPLQERINVSHDTILVRFRLPSPEHVLGNYSDVLLHTSVTPYSTLLGLPLGQHILLQATINNESVARSYTPTSSNLEKGYFDLVVKVYHANVNPAFPSGGKMSQHLNAMTVGDTINVKGPTGHVTYMGRGLIQVGKVKHEINNFVMIAAGSGITRKCHSTSFSSQQITHYFTNIYYLLSHVSDCDCHHSRSRRYY
jgi:nitrate reductase (NAD(P)H)